MPGETYLVTGGAGFIGSHVAEILLERGKRVRIFDNFSTGRRDNINGFIKDIELVEADIRDFGRIREAVDGCAYVIHQAALPSVERSVSDPVSTEEVNVIGTLNLLLSARDAGVKKVVYASSSSVYGDSPALPKREDMKPNPLSPYAASKLAGEYYCRVFSRIFAVGTLCLRYFNVFGPRQNPYSQYAAVIPNFFRALCSGERPLIDGDGNQTRDFTYVSNVAEANLLACACQAREGEVYNIACARKTSINQLLDSVREVSGVRAEAEHGPPRPGDVRDSVADISRAVDDLGYEPRVDLMEGLRLTADYYVSLTHPGLPPTYRRGRDRTTPL